MIDQPVKVIISKYVGPAYKQFIESCFKAVEFIEYEKIRERGKIFPRSIVIYSGGADVNPDLYSEQIGKYTNISKERDDYEYEMYRILQRFNVLHIGICRGAQFLTVMAGGSLIQHVDGHTSDHDIDIPMLGTIVKATSTHHQMMYPYELSKKQYELLAWSRYFKATTYLNGRNEEVKLPKDFLEPEIVYYRNINSLAIQGHPEMGHAIAEFKNACRDIINNIYEKQRTF